MPLTQNFRGPQFGLKLVIDAETVRRLLCSPIEHVNNIPIMQFFIWISRNTQSKSYMLSSKTLEIIDWVSLGIPKKCIVGYSLTYPIHNYKVWDYCNSLITMTYWFRSDDIFILWNIIFKAFYQIPMSNHGQNSPSRLYHEYLGPGLMPSTWEIPVLWYFQRLLTLFSKLLQYGFLSRSCLLHIFKQITPQYRFISNTIKQWIL